MKADACALLPIRYYNIPAVSTFGDNQRRHINAPWIRIATKGIQIEKEVIVGFFYTWIVV